MQVQQLEQAQIDREKITSVAVDIAETGTYRPRHDVAIRELGLSVLSPRGCDRLVFTTDQGTVIKIPRTKRRTDINYDEAAVWSQYGDYDIFAPILGTGPDDIWLEMAECRPANDGEGLLSRFCEKMEETPIEIYDTHIDNIGWFGDELVAYDYPRIHVQREGFY